MKAKINSRTSQIMNKTLLMVLFFMMSYNAFAQIVTIQRANNGGISNCIPFGNNTNYNFTGFVYRNVPAFTMVTGDKIRFDLGNLNDVAVRRNIYFSAANINPAPYAGVSQNVTAVSWVQVVPESQTPLNAFGNTITGDFELIYTATSNFTFAGGGFIIGFGSTPPGTYSDNGCEQVGVITNSSDASGNFYSRFYSRPNLEMGVLDANSHDNGWLQGFKIESGICVPPAIFCPSNISVSNNAGQCGANVSFTATATGTSPTITYSHASGSFFPVGTTTVTATATNSCGTASCTFTVTVNDNQSPVITCPANVTRQCGSSTDPSAIGYATATDNCGATTVSYSDNSTSGSFLYLQTWESGTGGWFSKFGTGDPVILVSDPTAPSPSTVHKITTCASAGHYYSPLIQVVPGQTYCFSLWIRWEGGCWPFLGIDRYNAAGTYLGENWLIGQPGYPDGFGGTVTPVPATASGWNLYFKTITIPANVTQVRLKNEMFSGASKGGATLGFFDNIGFTNGSCTTSPGFCNQNYQILRTWTATDGSGNSSSCLQTITVVDNTPPAITCPANISVQCGTSTAPAATGSATATDNCSTPVIGYSDVSSLTGCSGTGTITRTWRATDECGNSSTCVQTITVSDNTNPVITCPANITVVNTTGQCGANVSFVATATDNCSTPVITYSKNPGTFFIVGTTLVTATATDACNNQTQCSFNVTVTDNENPTISCPGNISVNNDLGVCGAVVSYTVTSADNCPGQVVTQTAGLASGSVFPVGVTTNSFLVTDASGNTATCSFTVTVTDNENPVITCPSPIAVNTDLGVCGAMVTYTITSADNCSGQTVAQTAGLASGSVFPVGVTTNTFVVTDASNNTATCSFTVTVTDNEAPSITCAAAQTQTADEGVCNAAVTVVGPATGDNCGVASVINSFNNTADASDTYPVGTTTVTWTVTDIHGNTNTCTQDITVTDNEAPSITCAAAQTQTADAGVCNALVTVVGPATSDNCGVASVTNSFNNTADASGTYPVGTTVVTWTVTDTHGNTNTCTQDITVTDNEAPVISVAPVLSCYAANNFGCSINLGASASDNCGLLSLTSNAPGCFPVGTTTVTWTATDIHSNTSTATQLVTRNPEINIDICAGITRTIYTGTVNGAGPFGPQSINLTSTVSGGTPGYSYSWSPIAGLNNPFIANPVASPALTTTYTLTVTDSKGCTRSLSITINVLPLSSAICSGSGNNVKFSVCHIPPGNPSNPQNICISVNALNAHLTSGSSGHNNCYLGPCGQQLCFSTVPGAANLVQTKGAVEEKTAVTPVIVVEEPTGAFKVLAYPNPSAGEFSLQVISNSMEPIRVRIMDMNGVVKSVSNVVSKTNVIRVGANLLGGTYIAEVTQGENRQVIKLVKLN